MGCNKTHWMDPPLSEDHCDPWDTAGFSRFFVPFFNDRSRSVSAIASDWLLPITSWLFLFILPLPLCSVQLRGRFRFCCGGQHDGDWLGPRYGSTESSLGCLMPSGGPTVSNIENLQKELCWVDQRPRFRGFIFLMTTFYSARFSPLSGFSARHRLLRCGSAGLNQRRSCFHWFQESSTIAEAMSDKDWPSCNRSSGSVFQRILLSALSISSVLESICQDSWAIP